MNNIAGRLTAIVVTHERLDQLRVTLESLLAAPADLLQAVVVVDNASQDGTPAWLAAQDDPRLIVHRCDRNVGGAGGFEAGMRLVVARLDPDWIVVMDDDGRPAPGAIAAFHAAPRDARTAYAAAVRYPGGAICEMNRPGLNPFRRPAALLRALAGRGRDGYHLDPRAYDTDRLHDIDMASFVGLFVPRAAIERCGYPQGGLFLYGDDVIYSLGLRRAGFRIAFDPGLHFQHDCTTFAASDGKARVYRPLWKVYYTYRNGLIMYRAAAGPLFWGLLPVVAFKWRRAAARYGADAPAYLRLLHRALRDGVARRTDMTLAEVRALADAPQRQKSPPSTS
ncbi:putative glycosyl transferase [Oceaniovalibus guishaninsula JLT2003]|uniref:Putative glycosyl transferase n=1 Tax=Oceaniovalibus guishaninsula JLT2003 TaxID=1231392 RepID=K2HD48_9RHOB|nr:glycosyltransferase [Oceaniovalibus guishaninsula]EKE44507.1 putative glycosyl transferase [Oceaniovalibus guishaninsula JLT2003]